MLDLDELKAKWAEQDKKLNEIVRLNRRLLASTNLNKARSTLQRMTVFLGLEAVAWFAIVAWLGNFIYEHWGTLPLAVAGVACDLYAISMLAWAIRLIVAAEQVDYDKPIAGIQKQLEELRVMRIRFTQWGLLAGLVVWAPFAVVVVKAFLGLDINNAAWLVANVLFGLGLIPLAFWVSKKFGDRMGRSPFIQRLMRDIGGRSLASAQGFLGQLARWEASDEED